jgi:MEMO1 family protein
MTIDHALLMCHAPIVIPAVGGTRGVECLATTRAMAQAAEFLVSREPEVLVIVSPHTPRARNAWCIVAGDHLHGSMARFGAPECSIRLPNAKCAAKAVEQAAKSQGLSTHGLPSEPLDHGAFVPLWFACDAGWSGPTVLLALPSGSADETTMGLAIREASGTQRWAVLASGDMSHRLIPGAPAGHDPRAAIFDATFTDYIRHGNYRAAARISRSLRELAAEDVVQTTTVAAAACDWQNNKHRTLSYEGPFGVGYLEAILHVA